MNRRIDEPRFTGAGVVSALFCLGCIVAGIFIGVVISAVLS